MVSITLAVPKEIKKEMDLFPEINWSAIAREAIKQRLILLEKFRAFTKNSTLTDKDAIMLGRKVNKEVAKKYEYSN